MCVRARRAGGLRGGGRGGGIMLVCVSNVVIPFATL